MATASAPQHTRVRTEGRRVWIDGAKETFRRHFEDEDAGLGTPWAERSDTYMYLAQMRIAGWDTNYAELITVAGYGPSFAYAPRLEDKWMAHYFPIEGRDDRIAHATGCRYRWQQHKAIEDYWEALKAAIDAGQAVHAPNEEDVLFVGYEEADDPAGRRVLPVAIVFVDDDEWTWEQFAAWHARPMVQGWLGRVDGPVDPWPKRESASEVMEWMVRLAGGDDPRRQPEDGVVWGIDGIEAYADDLADLSKSGAPEDESGWFQGGWRGCHNVQPQMSGRPAAATWLRRIEPWFEEDLRRELGAAAAAYEEATAAWWDFDRALGRSLSAMPHLQAWQDAGQRRAGAEAVRAAAAHERVAVAAVARALERWAVS